MGSPRIYQRSPAEHLIDAARLELWAVRHAGNPRSSAIFRELAAEARAMAASE